MLLLERFLFIYLILFSESLVLLVLEETFCRNFSVFWQKENKQIDKQKTNQNSPFFAEGFLGGQD